MSEGTFNDVAAHMSSKYPGNTQRRSDVTATYDVVATSERRCVFGESRSDVEEVNTINLLPAKTQ